MNRVSRLSRCASLDKQAGIAIALFKRNKSLILCSYKKRYT
jgi:hypothetical protein